MRQVQKSIGDVRRRPSLNPDALARFSKIMFDLRVKNSQKYNHRERVSMPKSDVVHKDATTQRSGATQKTFAARKIAVSRKATVAQRSDAIQKNILLEKSRDVQKSAAAQNTGAFKIRDPVSSKENTPPVPRVSTAPIVQPTRDPEFTPRQREEVLKILYGRREEGKRKRNQKSPSPEEPSPTMREIYGMMDESRGSRDRSRASNRESRRPREE